MFEQPIPTLRRDGEVVHVLDQTLLPFRTETVALRTLAEAAHFRKGPEVYKHQISPWKEGDPLFAK